MGIEHGYRSTHIDSFAMQEDGTIGLIKQTKDGREQLCYVDAYAENSAALIVVQGGANGAIQIRVDGLDGEIVGYLNVDRVTGVHDLYFIFCGDGYRVMSWKFEK